MTTGEKITRLRKGNNLSQEEFAELLEISRQTVSKWENETAMPTKENLMRISEKFSLPLSVLVTDEIYPEEKMGRPAEPKAKNRIIYTYIGLLLIFAVQSAVIFGLHTETEQLEETVAQMYEQLHSVNVRMDRLHTRQQPEKEQLTHYEYEVLHYDRRTDMLVLRISLVPSDYSSTAQARIMATTSQGTHSAQAVLKNHSFEAELEIYREENTPVYLYLTDGDRVRSYLVDYLPNLKEDYRLDIIRTGIVGTHVMTQDEGTLDMRNGRIDVTYSYTVNSENENTTVYPEIAVLEIYSDGWLVDQRAVEQITEQDYRLLAEKQADYNAGETYRGTAFAYISLNTNGMGEYTVIENEHIKADSDITFKLILIDNHGVRYEKNINCYPGN